MKEWTWASAAIVVLATVLSVFLSQSGPLEYSHILGITAISAFVVLGTKGIRDARRKGKS
jgi:hypothetical protein